MLHPDLPFSTSVIQTVSVLSQHYAMNFICFGVMRHFHGPWEWGSICFACFWAMFVIVLKLEHVEE